MLVLTSASSGAGKVRPECVIAQRGTDHVRLYASLTIQC